MDELDLAVDTGDESGQSGGWADSIESTLDGINNPPEESPAVEQTTAAPRDERGRFAPKQEQTAPVEASESPAPAPEAPKPAAAPWKPSSWKPEELTGFETLPEHTRQAIERREREINETLQRTAQDRQVAKQIMEFSQPVAPLLAAAGSNPIAAFQEAMQLYGLLNGTPDQRSWVLNTLAQRYGVPLGQSDAQSAQPVDPVITATQQELAQLRQQVSAWQQAQAVQEQQTLQSDIARFQQSAPHFERVRAIMADLMEARQAATLQDAYDKAVWLEPSVRAEMLAQQDEARRQDAARKAQEARKAAAVNVSPRGAPPAQPSKPKSWSAGVDVYARDMLQ